MSPKGYLFFIYLVCVAGLPLVTSDLVCKAVNPVVNDIWCNENCNADVPNCPPGLCRCNSGGDDAHDDNPTNDDDPSLPPQDDDDSFKNRPVLSTYWSSYAFDNAGFQPYTNRLSDVWDEYTHIMVAFGEFSLDGDVIIDKLQNDEQFRSDVALKHSAGKKVLLSVGGQNCNWSGVGSNLDKVADNIAAIVANYTLDGVDLDDEMVVDVASENVLIKLVKLLRSKLDSDALLVLTPQDVYIYNTATVDHVFNVYEGVLKAVGHQVDFVQIMAYNNGDDAKTDYITWTDGFTNSAISWSGFPAAKLVLGLLSDTTAGASGFLQPNDAKALITSLRGMYDGPSDHFGGVMTWNSNSDEGGKYAAMLHDAVFN